MSAALSQPTDSTALAVLPAASVPTILAADKEDILGKLAAKVAAHEPDVSTPGGRREIASLAAEVASSKMNLVRLADDLTEELRRSTAAVRAERKILEDRMNVLKVQVRAPLTEFEDREARRVQTHEDALFNMQEIACVCDDGDVLLANVEDAYAHLSAAHAREWEEFGSRAERTYRAGLAKLDTCKATVQARDAAVAETARAQAGREEAARVEAARVQAEREAQIAADAAAQAKAEAGAEAERRAEVARVSAAAQAVRDQAAAVLAEQHRVAAAAKAEQDIADRRAADKAHRSRIDRAAADALALSGITPEQAVAIVTAIARGEVSRIMIIY